MSGEIGSPSPEDMDPTPTDETPLNSEQIGNLFEEQANSDVEGPLYKIVDLDKSKLFVNFQFEFTTGGQFSDRLYGAVDPTPSEENERIHTLSRARIWSKSMDGVRFIKYGREAPPNLSPKYSSLNNLKDHTEWEGLEISDIINQTEPLSRGHIIYDYRHIKGSDVGFRAIYSHEGKLYALVGFNGPGVRETHFNLEDVTDARNSKQSVGGLTFSESEGRYHFSIKDEKGKEHYVVKLKDTINMYEVVAETGAERLWKHPNSPPEADDQWKNANFPQLLGIEIDPVLDIDIE